jgi:L,D-peptidoglycan transpeptidase YkuD (ErfK/YbiS/YcfS/YnhG family)
MRFLFRCSLLVVCALLFSSCASLGTHFPSKVDIQDAKQVMVVVPAGHKPFTAVLTAWSVEDGRWMRKFGPWSAAVGRSGLAPEGEKREGDGRTPSGIYPLRTAFGSAPAINTKLTYRQATAHDFWIDEPASAEYNQWVSGEVPAVSHEKMLRTDGVYNIGAVIEYNTAPVVPGSGSAIFLHIWGEHGTKPTAGCVALSERRLRKLLAWLDTKQKPLIILSATGVQ